MAAILLLTENFSCSNFYKLQCYAVCLASTDIQTGEPEMELWFAVALPCGMEACFAVHIHHNRDDFNSSFVSIHRIRVLHGPDIQQ